MNTIMEKIVSSHRNVRSAISLQQYLESLAVLGVCRKSRLEQLQGIYNMGAVYQMNEIKSIYEDCQKNFSDWLGILNYTQNQTVLEAQLLLLADIKDDIMLAQAIRCVSIKYIRECTGYVSGVNEVNLFDALVGDCQTLSIAMPTAGMASVVSRLNADIFYLQEHSSMVYALSMALLFLENKPVEFSCGNSLIDFTPSKKPDVVLLSPPMGLRLQLAEYPKFHLLVNDTIPASGCDSLWIQLALSCLNENGVAHILLPQGWFFRGGYDAKVRDAMLNNEYIEAIIALPQKVLHFTAIAPYILVLNKKRAKGSPIHFVDASDFGTTVQNTLLLSREDCVTISALAKGKMPDDKRFTAKYLPEIRQADGGKGNSLMVSNFITKELTINRLNVQEEMEKLKIAQNNFELAQNELTVLLNDIT